MVDRTLPGTGIGRVSAEYEAAEAKRADEEYTARQKNGFPCGTHTLYRKKPEGKPRG